MAWPSEAEEIYQAVLAFGENERAVEFFEDEDWEFLDAEIFEPMIQIFCQLYGHAPGSVCVRCHHRDTE